MTDLTKKGVCESLKGLEVLTVYIQEEFTMLFRTL